MGSFIHTGVFFIVALGVLIAFHEFGHFWVARKLGVKVIRFSIGFGRPLWRYQKRPEDTEFVIAAIPLGGYVKMVDEREGEVASEDLPYSFNRQSLSVRSAIVAAGPVFNLVLAILLYWLVFITGETGIRPVVGVVPEGTVAAQAGLRQGNEIVAVENEATPTWEMAVTELFGKLVDRGQVSLTVEDGGATRTLQLSLPDAARLDSETLNKRLGLSPWQPEIKPVLGEIEKGGPADQAGLKSGDLIVSANDQPITDWMDWVKLVRASPDKTLTVLVERNNDQLNLSLTPALVENNGNSVGRIGAGVDAPQGLFEHMRVEYRLGLFDGLMRALQQTWDYSLLSVRMMGRMLTGQASVENLSGPISIAQYAGESASMGFIPFIKFLAIVSISLGVINLMPIPILDGGHLFFNLVEWIKGRPLSDQAMIVGQQVGLVLLLSLMGLAVFLDIERLFN